MPGTLPVPALVFLVAALTGAVCGQCGQWGSAQNCALISDGEIPDALTNLTAVTFRDYIYIFGGTPRVGCDDPTCGAVASVWGQEQTAMGRWRKMDDMPVKLCGFQFAAALGDRVFVVGAGGSLMNHTEAPSYHRNIYEFNPTAPAGTQWKTYSNVFPKPLAFSRVVAHKGLLYIVGGYDIGTGGKQTISGEIYTWNVTSKALAHLSVKLDRVDSAVVANNQHIFFLGGLRGGEWTQEATYYNSDTGVYKDLEQGLDRPWVHPTAGAVGSFLFVFGWESRNFVVSTWSNYSKTFLTDPRTISHDVPPVLHAGTTVTMNPGYRQPHINLFGGIGVDGVVSKSASHLLTGLILPSFSVSPSTLVVGEPFAIQFEGVTTSPTYEVRLSTLADCADLYPGSSDKGYSKEVGYSPPLSTGRMYPCFSFGRCPSNQSEVKGCTSDGLADFVGGQHCNFGCCSVYAPPACHSWVRGGGASAFAPLTTAGVEILAATPPPPSSSTSWISHNLPWVVAGAVAALLLIAVAVFRYYRRRPLQYTKIASGPFGEGSVISKYEMVERLGNGNYGVVYLMRRRKDGELFAMKYIPCTSDEDRDEAMREFSVIRGFQSHPNMIKVFETFMNWAEDDLGAGPPNVFRELARYVCIVMPYFQEGDLRHYISAFSDDPAVALPVGTIVSFTAQMCSLLDFLHSAAPPVVHRDLKPENILIEGGKIVVTDFGLARNMEATYCNTQAGSLPYIAPECWQRHYGTEVDMWAVGCIIYAMATRRVEPHNTRVMFSDAMRDPVNFPTTLRTEWADRGYDPASPMVSIMVDLLQLDYRTRPTARGVLQKLPPDVLDVIGIKGSNLQRGAIQSDGTTDSESTQLVDLG